MALNPNISLAVRGIELQDPLAQYGKFAAIQGAQQQNQLAQMQMQEYERTRAEEEGLRNYLSSANLTDPAARQGLMKYGKTGLAYGTALSAQEKAALEQQETRLKVQKGKQDFMSQALRDISRNPSDANITAYLEDLAANPLFSPEEKASVRSTATRILAMPVEQRGAFMASQGATAEGLKPGTVQINRDGQTDVVRVPAYSGAPTTAATYADVAPPPEVQAAKAAVAAAGRPEGARVYLPPQPKAEQEKRGEMLVAEYSDISKAAKVAAKILPSIDANLGILGKGFETGFGTEAVAAGASVLAALGVPEAEKFATNAQVFQSKATEAVLQKQLEQKGPQTESDAQRIDQIGAQLGKTTEGNKFLLTTAKEQLKRDMEQRNFYDSWWKQNKTYDGAEDAWYSGEGGKSLFDRPTLKKYLSPTSSGAAIPGQTAAAPQDAIDALKAGRGTDAQFDQMFGAGAAKRARGGK